MGLGVRLKELSFHLAGKAALEPPQTWEKSCRKEVEEASEGVDAGGRDWRRPSGSRQSLVPHRHLSAVKGNGCKEVKSLPSMPKPSHSLCHATGNITAREAAPPELRRAVGHGGQWDAECWGRGRRLRPSPRLLPPSICGKLGTAMERKRTAQAIAPNPPFPSSASIRDGCGFC